MPSTTTSKDTSTERVHTTERQRQETFSARPNKCETHNRSPFSSVSLAACVAREEFWVAPYACLCTHPASGLAHCWFCCKPNAVWGVSSCTSRCPWVQTKWYLKNSLRMRWWSFWKNLLKYFQRKSWRTPLVNFLVFFSILGGLFGETNGEIFAYVSWEISRKICCLNPVKISRISFWRNFNGFPKETHECVLREYP